MDSKKKAELLKKYNFCYNDSWESENTNYENIQTTFDHKPVLYSKKWEKSNFSQNTKYTPQGFLYGNCKKLKKKLPEDKRNVVNTQKTNESFGEDGFIQEEVKEMLRDDEEIYSKEDDNKLLDLLLQCTVEVEQELSNNDQEIDINKDQNLKADEKSEEDDRRNLKESSSKGKTNDTINKKIKLVKAKNPKVKKIPRKALREKISSFTVKRFYESIGEIKDVFGVIGFCKFVGRQWCLFSHCKCDNLPGIVLDFRSALRLDQLDIAGSNPVQIYGCLKLRDEAKEVEIAVSGCVRYISMDDFLAGVEFSLRIEQYVSKKYIE